MRKSYVFNKESCQIKILKMERKIDISSTSLYRAVKREMNGKFYLRIKEKKHLRSI